MVLSGIYHSGCWIRDAACACGEPLMNGPHRRARSVLTASALRWAAQQRRPEPSAPITSTQEQRAPTPGVALLLTGTHQALLQKCCERLWVYMCIWGCFTPNVTPRVISDKGIAPIVFFFSYPPFRLRQRDCFSPWRTDKNMVRMGICLCAVFVYPFCLFTYFRSHSARTPLGSNCTTV